MARIWSRRLADGYCVTISGRLSAGDLRRLERVCGPALERQNVALAINVSRVTGTDPAADAFIGRLVECGARLVRSGRAPGAGTAATDDVLRESRNTVTPIRDA